MSILIVLLVLLVSIYLVANLVGRILNVWLDMTCFWGRVIYRKLNDENFGWEYKFTIGKVPLFGGIIGAAGMLWSIIKLAMIVAI